MNTQYRKNLKDVATACKNYTDKKIDDLRWELGSHTLDVESDTTTAYIKTVPSGAIKCHINKIGGMSYKVLNDITQEYEIRNSPVTSVVSKDSNATTLDTLTIPAEVQALEGYGWGVNDTCYNYIDLETKKFVKKVGRVDLGTLTWSYSSNRFSASCPSDLKPVANGVQPNWLCATKEPKPNNINLNNNPNAICYIVNNATFITYASSSSAERPSGYLYYELATPVETDITLSTNEIVIEAGGTITFTNTYEQAVPSEVDYLIEEVKA